MKKLFFVLNPRAGTKKANKLLPELIAPFNRAGYEVQIYVTGAAGEAADQVAQKAAQVDLVVCCGGDGTFNETVSGVLKSGENTPIGYIPCGSTNDFAASIGISTDPLEAAKRIIRGRPREYDIGSFNGRYFTYVASFGAFTRASYSTSQSVKNALGHLAYILSGIQDLVQIRSIPIRLELDGGEVLDEEFIFGAVCNSTSIGGIMKLDASAVDMSDGKHEVFLVRAPKDLIELTECIGAIQKQKYDGCRMITFRRARSIRITASPELAWTLDGELETGHEEIFVKNEHLAIKLMK